jgi:hypothetical protein
MLSIKIVVSYIKTLCSLTGTGDRDQKSSTFLLRKYIMLIWEITRVEEFCLLGYDAV